MTKTITLSDGNDYTPRLTKAARRTKTTLPNPIEEARDRLHDALVEVIFFDGACDNESLFNLAQAARELGAAGMDREAMVDEVLRATRRRVLRA